MKWLKRIVLTAVMLLALGAAAVIWQGYQMYSDALAEKPLTEAVEEIQSQSQYTSLSQLPDMYLDAVVAVEDHRFWKHHGFDIIAIGRAVKNNGQDLYEKSCGDLHGYEDGTGIYQG